MAPNDLRLPIKDEPTYLNKEAAIGFLLFNIPGAILGGLLGKERMQRESRDGRLASEPTIWNKDMALGAAAGVFLMSAGALVGALAAGFGGFFLGAAATVIVGAVIGGNYGKNRMAEERQEALALRERTMQLSAQPEQAVGVSMDTPSYARSTTREEALVLESRMRQGNPTFAQFTEQLEKTRQQPAPTTPQV